MTKAIPPIKDPEFILFHRTQLDIQQVNCSTSPSSMECAVYMDIQRSCNQAQPHLQREPAVQELMASSAW